VTETADGVPRLRSSQYLGYGAGEVANNLTFQMVAVFLLIYYTDVADISASTAGTLLLVVRICALRVVSSVGALKTWPDQEKVLVVETPFVEVVSFCEPL